ncbi:eukaryotic translation initiation factor eIF-2-beta/eIF-5 family protein [Candidatus Nitrosopelagicus sp.]|nr:eukaryotic translation initiation factor eIF-2-beta/eIF-5 family protein [Candidatus Nitrosopelagicus sp.]
MKKIFQTHPPPVNVLSYLQLILPGKEKKTILRNFADFPKALRREPNIILQYLSKEFAVPADRVGEKAIFVGKRDPDDFTRLFGIYLKDYVECPTCQSPDTKVEKQNRISFLICEACGAKSTIKGKYA